MLCGHNLNLKDEVLEYTSLCKLHAPYMGSLFVVVRDAFIVVQMLRKQVCIYAQFNLYINSNVLEKLSSLV